MTDPWRPKEPGENLPWSEVEDSIPPGFRPHPGEAAYPADEPAPAPQPARPVPSYPQAPPPPPYAPPMGYGPPPGYRPWPGYPPDPGAPYGRNRMGEPFSDKQKTVAGLLQIFLGMFGAGRLYLNQPNIALAQIAVVWLTCGFGHIWPFIDGIVMLTGNVRDQYGRPLRD